MSRTIAGPRETWALLDRWPVWVGLASLLILLAYGPWFASYVPNFTAPGVRAW